MTEFMDLSLTTNNHDCSNARSFSCLIKDYQHERREEFERKTRLNSVEFHNFDQKSAL